MATLLSYQAVTPSLPLPSVPWKALPVILASVRPVWLTVQPVPLLLKVISVIALIVAELVTDPLLFWATTVKLVKPALTDATVYTGPVTPETGMLLEYQA